MSITTTTTTSAATSMSITTTSVTTTTSHSVLSTSCCKTTPSTALYLRDQPAFEWVSSLSLANLLRCWWWCYLLDCLGWLCSFTMGVGLRYY
ncbi:hypothetical protein HanRHA438_Chr12g0562431 [Helianthus annuus]|nr:hypothetical protein HanRHA438_Chr12g0562431 [Helianthus annuus]